MLHGLLVAKQKGFQKLSVKIDSVSVAGMRKEELRSNGRYYAIIQWCKDLIDSPGWGVIISHCYRKSNQVVDILANLGIELNCDLELFNEPPKEVFASLYADHLGAKSPRLYVN